MKCVICQTTKDVNLVDGEKVCMDNSCRRTAFCVPDYESSDDDLDESSDEEEQVCMNGSCCRRLFPRRCVLIPVSSDEESSDYEASCEWCGEEAVIALKETDNLESTNPIWNRYCKWDNESDQVLACRQCGEGYLTDYPETEHRPFAP